MQNTPIEILIAIIFGVGVMALLSILYGVIECSGIRETLRSAIHGICFGFGAMMVMLVPVHLGVGVIFDARAIIVGMAAAFGGWPAAILSAVVTSLYRAHLGGAGVPAGVLAIFLAAALGLFWAWRLKPRGRLDLRAMSTLGVTISLNIVSAVLLPHEIVYHVVVLVVPPMIICCIASAILMGNLLERERRNIYAEKTWREAAHTDPLTALLNRRGFFDKVERGLLKSDHEGTDALLVLDADHFKCVNDNHGHTAGDAALIVIAEKLKSIAGSKGSVGRLGGEEFAVFLPATTQTAANKIAEILRSGIRNADLTFDGVAVPLSVSIGVAMRSATSQASLISLLQSADAALYSAKETGRDKVVFAQSLEA